jgi:hypothetical protein
MAVAWWGLLTLSAPTLLGLVLRGRLAPGIDRLSHGVIRLCARSLPEPTRSVRTEEWLAELAAILLAERRHFRGLLFAAGLVVSVRPMRAKRRAKARAHRAAVQSRAEALAFALAVLIAAVVSASNPSLLGEVRAPGPPPRPST